MKDPTEKQKAVMDKIKELKERLGYPPTIAELAQELNTSAPNIQNHLDALRRKGLVRNQPGKLRTLAVV